MPYAVTTAAKCLFIGASRSTGLRSAQTPAQQRGLIQAGFGQNGCRAARDRDVPERDVRVGRAALIALLRKDPIDRSPMDLRSVERRAPWRRSPESPARYLLTAPIVAIISTTLSMQGAAFLGSLLLAHGSATNRKLYAGSTNGTSRSTAFAARSRRSSEPGSSLTPFAECDGEHRKGRGPSPPHRRRLQLQALHEHPRRPFIKIPPVSGYSIWRQRKCARPRNLRVHNRLHPPAHRS